VCEAAERAATNRRQKKIELPDAIILATADVAKRQLMTRNVKDFPAGMRGVRVPYKV
jgi:predicted nucleic acid-binding protein